MQKYVGYYRVSTVKQGVSGLGIEAQKEAVASFLNYHKPIAEFQDIAKSGKDDCRPQLMEAIAYAKKHQAKLLIAKLDRLSRNMSFVSAIMDAGIEFTCCDMPEANELTIHIIAAIAQYERKLCSQRTKSALKAKMAKVGANGFINKKGKRCYTLGMPENFTDEARAAGAKAVHAKALNNPNNRKAAAMAIVLRDQGKTLPYIADALNTAGFKTAQDCRFEPMQVSRLLKRHQAA